MEDNGKVCREERKHGWVTTAVSNAHRNRELTLRETQEKSMHSKEGL